MTKSIAINGTLLHKVSMPMVPDAPNSKVSRLYPAGQYRITLAEDTLVVSIPSMLAVELYRIGLLPQDAQVPVKVSYDGTARQYVVSDVHYGHISRNDSDKVTFTFTAIRPRRTPTNVTQVGSSALRRRRSE